MASSGSLVNVTGYPK